MPTFTYVVRGRSFVRSTILLLAVAGTGYVAGAFVQNPVSPRNDSVAFARTVQASETDLRNALSATDILSMEPAADESRRSDAEWTQTPRECNLARGISTACLFMD